MNLDDLANDKSVVDAQVRFQHNSTGPLRTSESQNNEPGNSLVTYDLSSVMQGMALYKPTGVAYDAFNQELSKELQNLGVEEERRQTNSVRRVRQRPSSGNWRFSNRDDRGRWPTTWGNRNGTGTTGSSDGWNVSLLRSGRLNHSGLQAIPRGRH